MPRLVSTEKGGFYEIPPFLLPYIASLFAPSPQGGKILDPCAGEGVALQHLAGAGGLTPYAMDIAVFPEWHPYLVQHGRVEGLLKPLICYGGVKIWEIQLQKSNWQRLICQGLQHRRIHLP